MTRRDMAQVLGTLVLLFASCVLLSYLIDAPALRRWAESDVGMAIPTALCLVLLSIAVGLISQRDGP